MDSIRMKGWSRCLPTEPTTLPICLPSHPSLPAAKKNDKEKDLPAYLPTAPSRLPFLVAVAACRPVACLAYPTRKGEGSKEKG